MKIIFILSIFLFILSSTTCKSEDRIIKERELKRIENEIKLFNSPENIQKVKQKLIDAKYFKNLSELDKYDIILEPTFMIDTNCINTKVEIMNYVDSTSSLLINNDCTLQSFNFSDSLEFLKKFKEKYPKANIDTVHIYEDFLMSDYTCILEPYKNNTIYSCIQKLLKSNYSLSNNYVIKLYSKFDSSFIFYYVSKLDNSLFLITDDKYFPGYKEKKMKRLRDYIPKDYITFDIETGKMLVSPHMIIIGNKIYSIDCLRIKKRKIPNLEEIINFHLDECKECEIDNYLRWEGIKK